MAARTRLLSLQRGRIDRPEVTATEVGHVSDQRMRSDLPCRGASRRDRVVPAAVGIALMTVWLLVSVATAATAVGKVAKTAKPQPKVAARRDGFIPNGRCTKVGVHQPNSTYDCVRVGGQLFWRSLGTVNNPVPVGQSTNFAMTQTVATSRDGSTSADIGLSFMLRVSGELFVAPPDRFVPDPTRTPIPTDHVVAVLPLSFISFSGYAGNMAEAKVDIDIIDSSGTAYSVLGDRACERYGDTRLLELLPSTRMGPTLGKAMVGNLCAVVPVSVMSDRSTVVRFSEARDHRLEILLRKKITAAQAEAILTQQGETALYVRAFSV